jgi:hypothetical protein
VGRDSLANPSNRTVQSVSGQRGVDRYRPLRCLLGRLERHSLPQRTAAAAEDLSVNALGIVPRSRLHAGRNMNLLQSQYA